MTGLKIFEALRASGYDTVDAQAKVLGVPRSTAWFLLSGQHKKKLKPRLLARILANPDLPKGVRDVFDRP